MTIRPTATLVLAAAVASTAGCATADRVHALEEKVAAMEAKVAELEKRPAGKATAAAATPADPAKEEAAKALYKEITDASEKWEFETAKTKLTELNQKYPDSGAAKAAKRLTAELEVIGKPVPANWSESTEKWFQGTGDLSKGATLVVFWEIWCPHCKREVPALEATYQAYKGKGLNVVGLTRLTRDKTEAEALAFIKDNKVTYPMAKDKADGGLAEAFNVSGIPAAAIVKDGKIVWRGHPARLKPENLDKMLAG